MKSPVLVILFNRYEFAERLLGRIREARPSRLYFAADGPRPNHSSDAERCSHTRTVVDLVDWPCEIQTLFRDENLGPGKAISESISWFFEREEEGVVFEEDCHPSSQFFEFCDAMLEKYRDEERVAQVGGRNNLPESMWQKSRYFFSSVCTSWGWASWRRYWKRYYDYEINSWPDFRESSKYQKAAGLPEEHHFWTKQFDRLFDGRVDTWDYQLLLSMWEHDLLCVRPGANLVKNVGFGEEGLNTTDPEHPEALVPFGKLEFPLEEASPVRVDKKRDWLIRQSYLRSKPDGRRNWVRRKWKSLSTGLPLGL